VKYERPTSAAKSTVRCDYCHSQLIAPNELAGQPAQIIRVHFGSSKFPKWILLVLAIPLIGLFIGLLAAFGTVDDLRAEHGNVESLEFIYHQIARQERASEEVFV